MTGSGNCWVSKFMMRCGLAIKNGVESCLQKQTNGRDEKWTRSLAVGSESFIAGVKRKMGVAAKGRKQIDGGDSYQLREKQSSYGAHSGAKNSDIEVKNTYFLGLMRCKFSVLARPRPHSDHSGPHSLGTGISALHTRP